MAALNRLLRAKGFSSSSFASSSVVVVKRSFSSSSTAAAAVTSEKKDSRILHSLPRDSLPVRRDPSERNVQWVFLGCPGVGKGTYASRLCNLLGVPHIATGDLVREELASPSNTKLKEIVNQGKLVSDEIIIELLSKRLKKGEAKGESGFILDGFPRTINQAEILEGITDIDLVINLKLREDVLVEKCLGRRTCSQCGNGFNVATIDVKGENGSSGMYMPPLLPPAGCESKLITRDDDTELVVKERLRIYNEMSQPVEGYYRSRGKLMEFDLPGGIPESWPKLLQALNLDEHEDKRSAAA